MGDDEAARAARYDENTRQAYEALGRYLAEFSRLVLVMRLCLTQALQWRGANGQAINLLTGEMQMYNLNNAFFGVFRHLGEHDDAEVKISRTLHNQVAKANDHRNNVAHGEWFIGWGSADSFVPDPPRLVRTRPGSADFSPIRVSDFPIEEMGAWTADLRALKSLVGEYAYRVAPHPALDPPIRASEVFIVRGGKVLREGPRAEEAGTWFGYA